MNAQLASSNAPKIESIKTDNTQLAGEWIKSLPKAQMISGNDSSRQKIRCRLTKTQTSITCNDAKSTTIENASTTSQPDGVSYTKSMAQQVIRQGEISAITPAKPETNAVAKSAEKINIIGKTEGLVGVAGDLIEFKSLMESREVVFDPSLKNLEWSIFVRDASAIGWNESKKTLTALKPGQSEVFVVTPGRISIIKVHIHGQKVSTPLVAIESPKSKLSNGIEIPTSIASLDGLDYAASSSSFHGSHAGLSAAAPDLVVSDEIAQVGSSGLASSVSFSRAKQKISFAPVIIKVVDDRSNPGVSNFPLSGIRVKIIGTEFQELTNARGEVEVRDVPVGGRLMLELTDERGHIMPQMTEVHVTADASTEKTLVSTVMARRFSSLDLAARAVGVVQDMQKSSICGTVANGPSQLPGYTVSLDVTASGPFYFNHLGFADVRMGATGNDGRFCFFNVEPGPATLAIRSTNSSDVLSIAYGMTVGHHQEERFNIADAKYLSASMAAVAAANEQLGADGARANRHDLVETGDVYAIGSGDLMLPVEDGRLVMQSPVLPFKGRVWTVTSSSDFETTVQALQSENATAGQILKMVPNGFINDMSYFAHTTHSSDLGSVVVEHGHLGGQGQPTVKMRLVDPFGRDVGDGWYFSDQPVAKAVFFNVPPGTYSLIVETESGHWIAAETVLVYSDSLSFVATGSLLERRSMPRSRQIIE
jgi:hypothetical protein